MANNLLDTIKSNLGQTKPQAPQLGKTEQVQKLLQAKRGKEAAPSAGPRQSALGERIAARQAELGSQQLAQQAKITEGQQEQQATDIEAREEQQQKLALEQRAASKDKFDRQTESLLNDYARGQRRLESQQDIANLEAIGFNLRLDNKKYLNDIQNEGAKARLDDENSFRTSLMNDVLGDNQKLKSDDIAFNTMMNANDNEFREQLANIDINYAMEVAESNIKAAQSRQMAEGIATLAGVGVQAFSTKDNTAPSESDTLGE